MVSGKILLFVGERIENHPLIIAYVKAIKYLQKGYQGFVTSVVETSK